MAKRSERQQLMTNYERTMDVYKRDDMIQRARFRLNVMEQRIVLYTISKIKPTDTEFQEYVFDIKEFYALCGLGTDSYNKLKEIIKKLRDRSWWMTLEDGTETTVSWFAKPRINKRSGKVILRFDEDMMPYLLELTKQNTFYTRYNLQYVLPMSCSYSPRLYEILKSYQKNNAEWYFDIDELRHLLDCENYVRFPDFRRFALEPAVAEINKYTDLKIAYKAEKEGRKVSRIHFGMVEKTRTELARAEDAIETALDGEYDFTAQREADLNDPILKLRTEHKEQVKKDEEIAALARASINKWLK